MGVPPFSLWEMWLLHCQVSPCHSWPPTDPCKRETHTACSCGVPYMDSPWLGAAAMGWCSVWAEQRLQCQGPLISVSNLISHISPVFTNPLVSFTLLFKVTSLTSLFPPPKVCVISSYSLIWLLIVILFSTICLRKAPLRLPGVFHSSMFYSHFQATPIQTVFPKGHHMNSPAVRIPSIWNITK